LEREKERLGSSITYRIVTKVRNFISRKVQVLLRFFN